MAEDHPLDNPAWHALRGPQAHLGSGGPDAVAYHPEVGIFAATERNEAESWYAALKLAGPHGVICLFRESLAEPPDDLEVLFRGRVMQMVLHGPPRGASRCSSAPLCAEDVRDMLALTELTQPGPFFERTVEMGGYRGVREDGRLIAMAGERFHPPGHTEISAVCTHPDARGRGLAASLSAELASAIRARGETPFLHVLEDNAPAIRVYQALGFEHRTTLDVVMVRAT